MSMSLQLLVTFLLTITVSPVASCSVLFTCLAALAAWLNMGLLKQCLTVFSICQVCAFHFSFTGLPIKAAQLHHSDSAISLHSCCAFLLRLTHCLQLPQKSGVTSLRELTFSQKGVLGRGLSKVAVAYCRVVSLGVGSAGGGALVLLQDMHSSVWLLQVQLSSKSRLQYVTAGCHGSSSLAGL